MFNQVKTLIQFQLISEWRSKQALSSVLIYILSSVYVCYMAFKQLEDSSLWIALFWILNLFAISNASSIANKQKEGLSLYYYQLISAQTMIVAKILFNCCLMLIVSGLSYYLMQLFLPISAMKYNAELLLYAILLGTIGLSTTLTFVSEIANKANASYTLLVVLSFPLIIPTLMLSIRISTLALENFATAMCMQSIISLLAVNVLNLILAYLLFPFVYKD